MSDKLEEIVHAHNSILNLTQFYGGSLNLFNQKIFVLEQRVKALADENAKLQAQLKVATGAKE